eukprot:1735740-Prymnesium_polylepis.2
MVARAAVLVLGTIGVWQHECRYGRVASWGLIRLFTAGPRTNGVLYPTRPPTLCNGWQPGALYVAVVPTEAQ